MQSMRKAVAIVVLTLGAGCSRSNNILLGRVQAQVAGHTVIVTDCYRPSVPPPSPLAAEADVPAGARFTPCRDADVVIRGDRLTVNGKAYGSLTPTETVVVDHGVVRLER